VVTGRSTSTSVWSLVRLLPPVSPALTLATVATIVGTAAVPVALMLTVGWLVGHVATLADPAMRTDTSSGLILVLACLAVLVACQQAVGSLLSGLGERLGRRFSLALRERLMTVLLRPVGLAHLEDSKIQDLAGVAQGLRGGYAGPMGSVVGLTQQAAVVLAGLAAAAVLLVLSPVVAVPLLALHLLVGFWSRREHRRGLSLLFVNPSRLRRSAYFRDLILRPGAEKELRVFGLGRWALDLFHTSWIGVMRDAWGRRSALRWPTAVAFAGLAAGYALAAVVLAKAGTSHELTTAQLAIALQAVFGLLPLATVSEWDEVIQAGQDSVAALEAVEHQVTARMAAGPPEPRGDVATRPADEIRLDGVRFAYSNGVEVLRGIDMVIPVGRSCAIVGRNGSGKSTLLKLLLRFYEPTAGRVLVDGKPLAELDPTSWRRQFAAVFQDFLRLSVPVRDAVEFGSWQHRGDQATLHRVADRAGLTPVLDRLELGWDTMLSPQVRNGTDLSGGEWQKVAIARALYALDKGAEVLALDEPTASLDAETEREVYESVLSAEQGRTLILVSHRFSTVRKVDHIFVLDEGRVVEQGGHDELLGLDGLYSRMFKAQAGLLL
jgi:ATP-binding cassette, subfamily B, bacterial